MDYLINVKYPFSELENISEWWQDHREYVVNEIREPREYTKKPIREINPETGEEIIVGEEEVLVEREYDDYVEIVRRSESQIIEDLRRQRESLLLAFDKWEKAVLRGREQDSDIIMAWYEDLLDLKDTAFIMIPERIKYYL